MEVQTLIIITQRFVYQKFIKTSQRWMYVTKQFQNFDYDLLLPILNAFTVDTQEFYSRRCKI